MSVALADQLMGISKKADRYLEPSLRGNDDLGHLGKRKVTHWSMYILIAGSLVGVVTTVATWVLGLYVLMPAGLILAITNGTGAYYNRKFSILYNSFYSFLKPLTKRIDIMGQNLFRYKKENRQLSISVKNISEENDRLENLYKEYKKNSEKILKEEKKESKKIRESLKKTEKTLSNFQELYGKLSVVTQAMTKEMARLTQSESDLENTVDLFGSEVDELGDDVEDLDHQIDRIAKHVENYTKENQKIVKLMDVIKRQLKLMRKMGEEDEKKDKEFEKNVDKLDEVDDKVAKSSKSLAKASKEVGDAVDEMGNVANDLKMIIPHLTTLKKLMEELKKHPDLKLSDLVKEN